MQKSILFLVLILLAAACSPRSLEEYQEEGGEKIVALIHALEPISTREQLRETSPRLKQLFNELTDLMIAAREFRDKHRESDSPEPTQRSLLLSRKLRLEIERLYRIDGCREIIEHCQEEAMFRLDAYEKRHFTGKF